jgi:uncharacterized protein HemY
VRAILAEVAAGAPVSEGRRQLGELLAAEREALPSDDPRRTIALLAAARLDVLAGELALAADRLAQVEQLQTAANQPSPAERAELAVTRGELERARGRAAAARALGARAIALCDARACETAGVELARRAERLLHAPI